MRDELGCSLLLWNEYEENEKLGKGFDALSVSARFNVCLCIGRVCAIEGDGQCRLI